MSVAACPRRCGRLAMLPMGGGGDRQRGLPMLRVGRSAGAARARRAGTDAGAAEPDPAAAVEPRGAAHGAVHLWPAEYLARLAICCAPSTRVALAHSLDRDSGWIAAKRGGYADTWRERHDQGCEIIARGLRSCRVPVF